MHIHADNSERLPMKRSAERPSRVRTKELMRVAGLPAVSALFSAAPARVEQLFFDRRMQPHASAFCEQLAAVRKPYRLVQADELERIAGTILHGGIVALAHRRPVPSLDLGLAEMWARDGRLLLLLDGVGNPHNLGAIARTAAFFGIARVVISDHPAQAGPSDAAYRVAEGGLEYVETFRGVRFAAVLRDLRKHYRVIAAAADRGQPLTALRPGKRPFALILGNEEHGLPHATLAACDEIVTIPGSGLVQSLNVAATAAIMIYALAAAGRSNT